MDRKKTADFYEDRFDAPDPKENHVDSLLFYALYYGLSSGARSMYIREFHYTQQFFLSLFFPKLFT